MTDSIVHLQGRLVVDDSGEKVGTVTDVLVDPINLEPEWLVLKTGRLAGEHLVPFDAVTEDGEDLLVAVGKESVKTSPRVHDHAAPTREERHDLRHHYGLAD
jgi:sporulation protein YlmC with PRC-barrel domain